MPGLTTAEHRRALAEAKARRAAGQRRGRAALARAWVWVETLGATVAPQATPSGVLYTVRIPGFHSQTARRLVDAVAVLDAHLADWCAGGAAQGPTGAKLAPLCEKRRILMARTDGTG